MNVFRAQSGCPLTRLKPIFWRWLHQLNNDPKVHGILVQLPLPGHLNSDLVINSIDPAKDVDGFHVSNVGLLGTGQKSMVPCTPAGLFDECCVIITASAGGDECRGGGSIEHRGQADGATVVGR